MKPDLSSYFVNWAGAGLMVVVVLCSSAASTKAQGLVMFANTAATLVSDGLNLDRKHFVAQSEAV